MCHPIKIRPPPYKDKTHRMQYLYRSCCCRSANQCTDTMADKQNECKHSLKTDILQNLLYTCSTLHIQQCRHCRFIHQYAIYSTLTPHRTLLNACSTLHIHTSICNLLFTYSTSHITLRLFYIAHSAASWLFRISTGSGPFCVDERCND